VHPLEIEGQGHEGPFPGRGGESPERELSEAHHLLDDPEHGFHRRFAGGVEGAPGLGLESLAAR